MNIDYEAIAKEIQTKGWAISLHAIKDIIEAYEAQKTAPEWVPLDLSTIKQGWELRIDTWATSVPKHVFIAAYDGDIIFVADYRLGREKLGRANWLMCAPKPKTVRVWVLLRSDGAYEATAYPPPPLTSTLRVVGEGDIEVSE